MILDLRLDHDLFMSGKPQEHPDKGSDKISSRLSRGLVQPAQMGKLAGSRALFSFKEVVAFPNCICMQGIMQITHQSLLDRSASSIVLI